MQKLENETKTSKKKQNIVKWVIFFLFFFFFKEKGFEFYYPFK